MTPKLPKWSSKSIPSQFGKIAVVTGSTSGLGYEVALKLAIAGAHVVLADCNERKGSKVIADIKEENPDVQVTFIRVDLSSLDSIQHFAQEFGEKFDQLDILVNNSEVMALPERQESEDGFEMHFGNNYLGHFAITARLLQYLASCIGVARVVNVSSRLARRGKIDFDDLMSVKKYKPLKAYANSKLANLLFTFELQRRSDNYGWGFLAVAAHPSYVETNCCTRNSFCFPRVELMEGDEVLPILYAATSHNIKPGSYYVPVGFFSQKREVVRARIPNKGKNLAKKLWEESEQLVKIKWPTEGINAVGVMEA